MKIFVCIKQVPDTDTRIKIAADQSGIDPASIKWILNPYDLFAVEESVKIKETTPGTQVYVLTVGPKPRVTEALVTALAMGADEGIYISTSANLDSYQTAKALATVIAAETDAKLVLTGKSSIDLNQSAVPQMLAQFLGWPHATVISKAKISADSAVVERDIEGGAKEVIDLKLPAVLAANKGLNSPRYTSLPGIMKAKKKVLKEVDFATLGIGTEAQKVKYSHFTLPPEKPAAQLLSGSPQEQSHQLVQKLRDEAKVL